MNGIVGVGEGVGNEDFVWFGYGFGLLVES